MQQLLDIYPFVPLLFFPLVWCLVCFLIAQLSGWAALSRKFRSTGASPSQSWGMQSARMRWGANYGSCLTVGAEPAGLYLATLLLFRIGHPPLLLPWPEVSVRRRWKMLFFRYVQLQLGREEQIPLRISGRLADRIQAAAGQNWPVEPVV